LCSFRCRVDSRWTHDRARSGQQIEQLADGHEFVGLLCHLDPPEHKAPSRREVMWIGGSLAKDRKHAEFSTSSTRAMSEPKIAVAPPVP
jgi:hypothetical protein